MGYNDYITLLSSVISRVNLVSACLPDEFHEDIEDIRTDLINLLKENKCEVKFSDVPRVLFLDMVSLYEELNIISRDLSCCLQYTSDEAFEEATFDIGCIMQTMANRDSVFRYCYNDGKKRVLK